MIPSERFSKALTIVCNGRDQEQPEGVTQWESHRPQHQPKGKARWSNLQGRR